MGIAPVARGHALLNRSNPSINISEIHGPGGSDVSFDPQLWAHRTLTSTDNLPTASNPDFIWVFSNSSQLQNGSTSGAWGGIPGTPLEAGNESRELQAVVWVNVTPTSSLGSAAAQLQDLFEGLMLTLGQNLSSNTSNKTTLVVASRRARSDRTSRGALDGRNGAVRPKRLSWGGYHRPTRGLHVSERSPSPEAPGTRTVRLPSEIVVGIEARIRGSAFPNVDAFVSFVLARLLDVPGGPGLSEEEERGLKERLRSLGYID